MSSRTGSLDLSVEVPAAADVPEGGVGGVLGPIDCDPSGAVLVELPIAQEDDSTVAERDSREGIDHEETRGASATKDANIAPPLNIGLPAIGGDVPDDATTGGGSVLTVRPPSIDGIGETHSGAGGSSSGAAPTATRKNSDSVSGLSAAAAGRVKTGTALDHLDALSGCHDAASIAKDGCHDAASIAKDSTEGRTSDLARRTGSFAVDEAGAPPPQPLVRGAVAAAAAPVKEENSVATLDPVNQRLIFEALVMSGGGEARDRAESWGGMSDLSFAAGGVEAAAAIAASALHHTGIIEDVTAAARDLDLPDTGPSPPRSRAASSASSCSPPAPELPSRKRARDRASSFGVPKKIALTARKNSLASLSDGTPPTGDMAPPPAHSVSAEAKSDMPVDIAGGIETIVANTIATVEGQLSDIAAAVEKVAAGCVDQPLDSFADIKRKKRRRSRGNSIHRHEGRAHDVESDISSDNHANGSTGPKSPSIAAKSPSFSALLPSSEGDLPAESIPDAASVFSALGSVKMEIPVDFDAIASAVDVAMAATQGGAMDIAAAAADLSGLPSDLQSPLQQPHHHSSFPTDLLPAGEGAAMSSCDTNGDGPVTGPLHDASAGPAMPMDGKTPKRSNRDAECLRERTRISAGHMPPELEVPLQRAREESFDLASLRKNSLGEVSLDFLDNVSGILRTPSPRAPIKKRGRRSDGDSKSAASDGSAAAHSVSAPPNSVTISETPADAPAVTEPSPPAPKIKLEEEPQDVSCKPPPPPPPPQPNVEISLPEVKSADPSPKPAREPRGSSQTNQKWDEMFDCLVAYVEEQREAATKDMSAAERAAWEWSGNVPTTFKSRDGKALGRWINNQRSAKTKGTLKKDREDRLVSTGLRWSVLATNAWPDMMRELRLYVKEQTKDGKVWDGNVPTNYKIKGNIAPDGSEIDEDKNLGRWINRQRSLYQAGKLKKERQMELDELGLKWSVLATTTWDSMFESLCQYAEAKKTEDPRNGWDGNVPANYKTDDDPPKSLGRWVNRQRSAFSKQKLKREYVEKLEGIGMKWSVHGRKPEGTPIKEEADIDDDNVGKIAGALSPKAAKRSS